jgi:predicted alpha/beta-hydrolase family hydrolase
MEPHALSIRIPGGATVSALWLRPAKAIAGFVFAHGAGAGMDHPFMQTVSEKLAAVKVATLRYQFPYMEARSRRPDRPAVCQAAVRAAVVAAHKKVFSLPLIAGGKSFGGRMTSQAQALEPLPGVVGLAFFGFPWHLPKRPSINRSEHLDAIHVPMLFMQGARDMMGEPELVKAQIRKRSELAVLVSVPGADHGFHVPVRSGRTDSAVQDELVSVFAKWVNTIA